MVLHSLKTAPFRLGVAACVWACVLTPTVAAALTRHEAGRDTRFTPLAPQQDVRIKLVATAPTFPYYGIPDNGCARGNVFVRGELATSYDGAPAGQHVVLRLDDAALPAGKVGTTLTFSGLRRAGLSPDGTFVYCGKLPEPAALAPPTDPPAPPREPALAPAATAPVTAPPVVVASANLPPPPPPPPALPPAPPAPPPAALRPALPPVPDNGPVTEVHKGKMGVIVFAASGDVVTTPEKPDKFKDTFTSTDSIFLRAYLPRSLNNAFRAEGIDCQEPFRTWQLAIDGVVVPRGKDDPYFYWEPLDDRGFTKTTSVRYDEALNGKKKDENGVWRAFRELVAPKLTAGEHTLTLAVWGKCWSKNTKPADAYLSAPLATGSFKLSVTQGTQASVLSPAGMKNPALEKEAIAAIEAEWRGDKVQRLVLVGKAWSVESILFKGQEVPQKRRLDAEVFVRQPAGACRVFNVTLVQPAVGMKKFGATEFSTGDSREVDCAALKGKD